MDSLLVAAGAGFVRDHRFYEADEKRMRFVRSRFEFGMELTGKKVRVAGDFNHLDQIAIGRKS